MAEISVLLLAGGIRDGSLNEKLVAAACDVVAGQGASPTRLSLADFPLPLFGAAPHGLDDVPEALALKAAFQSHRAIILANPEHNGSVSAMLKNAIDWMSCPSGGEPPQVYSAFRGKAFGLLSASSSPFGGLRGLSQLRHILASVQGLVVPEQLSVPHAHRAFDDAGQLNDPFLAGILGDLVASVIAVAGGGARSAA